MKTRNRMLSTLMAIMLLCSMSLMAVPAAAAGSTPERELQAQALCAMGLFKGYDNSGKNFGLNDLVSREHALTFLIRMLGEESAALAWKGATPYTDVTSDGWALPYIGYAKEKGYTVGIGDNKFGMNRNATMQEMAMFTLRGLGYSDAADVKDFDYNSSLKLAKEKGILNSDQPITPFTRGEAVVMIFQAMGANIKGEKYDLLSKLVEQGVVTDAQYKTAMSLLGDESQAQSTENKPGTKPETKPEPKPDNKAAVTGVSVSPSSASITVGKTKQLSATVAPSTAVNTMVSWSSNNSAVASVDAKGLVKGVKAGTATITAKTSEGGKTATCKITVTASTPSTPETPDGTVIKANFKMLNSTGKSIADFYIADSAQDKYGDDFLIAHDYRSWTSGKNITTGFEFYQHTSFDFYVRYTDGTEAEATELSFADATSAGGTLTVKSDVVTLTVGGKVVSKVPLNAKSTGLDANSKKVTDRFNASVKRYNALVDQINALGMSKDAAFTKSMNGITAELDKMTDVIGEGTGELSAAQLTEYTKALDTLDGFMKDLEALTKTIKLAGDKTAVASKKLSERFAAAVKRYDAQVDQVNALGFTKDAEFVKNMNGITEELDKMTKVIGEGTNKLTEAQIKEYSTGLDALDTFMNQLDNLIKTAKRTTVPITVINNTGVNLTGLYLSPAKESTWGDNLGSLTSDGKVIIDVSYTASTPTWDLRAEDAAGDSINFTGLNFSKCPSSGATLTLTYNESTQTGYASLK